MSASRPIVRALVLACTLAPAWPLSAQAPPRAALFGGAMSARVEILAGGRAESMSSPAFLGQGMLSAGRMLVELTYVQGRLAPGAGAIAGRDLVDGRVFVGVRPWDWLSIRSGAQARAFVLAGGTRRWVLGELCGRAESSLPGGVARGYVEIWVAPLGSSHTGERLDRARGGEAALTLHPPNRPLWAELGYRIDRVQWGGTRRETLEGVSFTIGVGLPAVPGL